jgi:hypothetical protein
VRGELSCRPTSHSHPALLCCERLIIRHPQICSDAMYQGRKAFDRHFQESRHAFGMRALGESDSSLPLGFLY